MSDVLYTPDGHPFVPDEGDGRMRITVRPRVKDLITEGSGGDAVNPLEFLYGSPQANGEPTQDGRGKLLRDLLQSAGRDATNFVTGLATAPYRAVQAGIQRTLGEPLSSDDRGLDAAGEAAQLAMGGGFAAPKPRGILGSAGGRLNTPMKTGPFYSAVEHAVANAPQAKMTPEQWRGWLRNQPGVKAEELDFMGLGDNALHPSDWKPGQPVTKQQMLEHAEGHGVKLKEVEKKFEGEASDDIGNRVGEQLDEDFRATHPELEYGSRRYYDEHNRWRETPEAMERERIYEIAAEQEADRATKFHDYQLPGGDNYRELLLTLPKKEQRSFEQWSKENGYGDHPGARNLYNDIVNNKRTDANNKGFISSHWDEPNVLVHMRMNDRDVPGVGKSLHLEEVQSDWHQQGRKKGYKQPLPKEEMPAAIEKLHDLETKLNDMYSKRDTAEYSALKVETDTLRNRITGNEGVPDAPFKSTWADLALKRAIAKAVDEGYDAVSWTPGTQQAERYDLSKRLDKVRIKANENGTYDVFGWPTGATGPGGVQRFAEGIPKEKLADTVGKDLADKIVADKNKFNEGGVKDYSGVDLKVGGEGMRVFYDKMLVDKANALGKKFGAKVEWRELPHDHTYEAPGKVTIGEPQGHANTDHLVGVYVDGKFKANYNKEAANIAKKQWEQHKVYDVNGGLHQFDTEAAAQRFMDDHQIKVPVLRLNDKLRDAASRKGMALFSSGVPFKFTPVDHDPFQDDKQ